MRRLLRFSFFNVKIRCGFSRGDRGWFRGWKKVNIMFFWTMPQNPEGLSNEKWNFFKLIAWPNHVRTTYTVKNYSKNVLKTWQICEKNLPNLTVFSKSLVKILHNKRFAKFNESFFCKLDIIFYSHLKLGIRNLFIRKQVSTRPIIFS